MTCKLVVLLSLFAAASAESGWCYFESPGGCKKGQHTLCLYPAGPAKACLAKGDLGSGFTNEHRQLIVDMHNQWRQTVASGNEKRGSNGTQPRAKTGRMPNLEWDDAIASIAQFWADQCKYGHDTCRDVDDYYVGQNIVYWSATSDYVTDSDIKSMVSLWYDEVRDFDRSEVRKFTGKNLWSVGHYTQVVWAETTKIGCGLRTYYEDGWNRHYLVCNYAPGGNLIGGTIYET